MSPDFREGYGPEEFSLRRALPGEYLVEANFYGNTQQIIAGATTIQLQFITGFATPGAQDQRVTLRLRDTKEVVTVGRFNGRALIHSTALQGLIRAPRGRGSCDHPRCTRTCRGPASPCP
jgi:hypothetical protein